MKISGFYKVAFITACIASVFILFYVFGTQCNGSYIFCGMALYYIPFVWGFFLIACVSYFIFSRKQSVEKAVNFAVVTTILAFVLLIAYFRVGEYYANKPYRDKMAAEKAKCNDQIKNYYNCYEISNFKDEPIRNDQGKIEKILVSFDLLSRDYTGLANVRADEAGLGSTGNGVRFNNINVRAGETSQVDFEYELNPIWRPGSKVTNGKFSINISDDQSTANDVNWWFSWWIGDEICLIHIGGPNTLAHLMPNLVTKNYLTADFAR